jgi:hypothetical protein
MSKVASDQTSDEMVRDSAGGPGFPIQGKRDWPEARTINCALALRRNSKYKHSIFFFFAISHHQTLRVEFHPDPSFGVPLSLCGVAFGSRAGIRI